MWTALNVLLTMLSVSAIKIRHGSPANGAIIDRVGVIFENTGYTTLKYEVNVNNLEKLKTTNKTMNFDDICLQLELNISCSKFALDKKSGRQRKEIDSMLGYMIYSNLRENHDKKNMNQSDRVRTVDVFQDILAENNSKLGKMKHSLKNLVDTDGDRKILTKINAFMHELNVVIDTKVNAVDDVLIRPTAYNILTLVPRDELITDIRRINENLRFNERIAGYQKLNIFRILHLSQIMTRRDNDTLHIHISIPLTTGELTLYEVTPVSFTKGGEPVSIADLARFVTTHNDQPYALINSSVIADCVERVRGLYICPYQFDRMPASCCERHVLQGSIGRQCRVVSAQPVVKVIRVELDKLFLNTQRNVSVNEVCPTGNDSYQFNRDVWITIDPRCELSILNRSYTMREKIADWMSEYMDPAGDIPELNVGPGRNRPNANVTFAKVLRFLNEVGDDVWHTISNLSNRTMDAFGVVSKTDWSATFTNVNNSFVGLIDFNIFNKLYRIMGIIMSPMTYVHLALSIIILCCACQLCKHGWRRLVH